MWTKHIHVYRSFVSTGEKEMIDYIIPLYIAVAFMLLYLCICYLIDFFRDNEVISFVFGIIAAICSGSLFTIGILKTILWVRGL